MATGLDESALQAYVEVALSRVASTSEQSVLGALRAELTGRRSALTGWHRELGSLDPDVRRTLGRLLNDAERALTKALDARHAELAREARREQLASDRLLLDELVDLD